MAEDFDSENEERKEDPFPNPLNEDEGLPGDGASLGEKEVAVVGVYEQHDQTEGQPSSYVVLLRDSSKRSVPIWIGRFEAMAISLALEGATADRPLPYDMFNNVINRMGGHIERVLIDDLWSRTYYAKISITYDGKAFDVDSRPSDAIAMGLRAKSPIYIAESVLQNASVMEE